jgi:hypothetical protein
MQKQKNIISNGANIELWMVGAAVSVMLAGWWSVFHHTTENLIIGIFINPTIPIILVIFSAKL